VKEGIIFGYPCVCKDGKYEIVQGLSVDEFSAERMKATEAELREERDAVAHLFSK
jgi:malate dehydrogenase